MSLCLVIRNKDTNKKSERLMGTLIDMIKDGKTVSFLKCDNCTLWYITECGFEFPIPKEDMNTVFLPKDKALLFMRWIRKHLQEIASAKLLQEPQTSNQ